jgi:TetR/AcrR family transcriptional regulator, transcriptional repressor of bet genes
MTIQEIPRRTRIEDIRRRELVAAAHRVFLQDGLDGLTSARICAEAGLSPGILSYYFKGKDDVLFAMVRLNNRILAEAVVAGLRNARDPDARVRAIVQGNFPAAVYNRNAANAWVSVCAAAARNARFQALQTIFYRRLRSNLRHALGDRPDREALILTVGAMIDGLWLRKAAGEDVSRDQAVALVLAVCGLTP